MARWIQRRTLFLGEYTEQFMRDYLLNLTETEQEYNKNWVRNLGGTIVFGQLISDMVSDVAQGEGEERTDLVFDWHLGKEDLYGQTVDQVENNIKQTAELLRQMDEDSDDSDDE